MNRLFRCWFFSGFFLLLAGPAFAATYNLSSGQYPPCSTTWSVSGSTYTCSGDGRVTIQTGDVVTSSTAATISANNGFSITNATVGTSSSSIALVSTYGAVTVTATTRIFGSVSSGSGKVTLTGTTVTGNVSGTGELAFSGGSIGGNVQGGGGALSSTNTNIGGTVSVPQNSITINGGTLSDTVTGGCCKMSISNATVLAGLTQTSNDIELINTTVVGPVRTTNAVTLTNSTVYGTLNAGLWSTSINGNTTSKVYGVCTPFTTTPSNLCDVAAVTSCYVDTFDRNSLDDDWNVTSRSGSFGEPRVVNNRIRLTDNSGNVATGATLDRVFPGAGNFVQLQFKYYGYGGNGADGVAVVLSDASITPQPGAFGGPLGYGIKSGVSGFAGGWVGIGLDEFGNFSAEGGANNQGSRADAVAIRGSGSGSTGYRWLQGTSAGLSPGVDISGSTAGPGHIYRVTLDSRTTGRTFVSVERNTGAGFTTLISSFDIRAAANSQATIPANLYLTFTGSTGGSNNIHELDDVQVCATSINNASSQIDHFDLSYTSPALTCNPQSITVRACLNATCSSLYTGITSVDLVPASSGANIWTATSPATISGSRLTFAGGSAVVQLRHPTAGTVTLGTGASTPNTKPLSKASCSTTNCALSFDDSGLLLDIPNMTAVKPVTGTIRAVKKTDTTQACVPGFVGTRTINFSANYTDPVSGTKNVSITNKANTSISLVPANKDIAGATKSLSLTFDENGTAPLTLVRYDDAGKMTVSATYTGSTANNDAGLSMTSAGGSFISKPYGLCLKTASTCTAAGVNANCVAFPGGIRAGDTFPLTIQAVGWEVDGELLTADKLCNNTVTPNFTLSDIALASSLVAPTGGSNGVLSATRYNHAIGNSTVVSTSQSEVGVFTVAATPGTYMGLAVDGGNSANVGRFVPAYLAVTDNTPKLATGCTNASTGVGFAYQDQPLAWSITPQVTVTGMNRAGVKTENYDAAQDDNFWRLSSDWVNGWSFGSTDNGVHVPARLGATGPANATTSGANDGDGARAYRLGGLSPIYTRNKFAPVTSDAPFTPYINMTFDAGKLTDADGACYTAGVTTVGAACQGYAISNISFASTNSKIRLGRARIENANGSELVALAMPVRIETWQGSYFAPSNDDTCSVLSSPVLDTYTDSLSAGMTQASLTSPSASAASTGYVQLTAPGAGNSGSVRVTPTVPAYLTFDWSGDGTDFQSPSGIAVFGTYQGARPLIYRREVYR